jgi:hypothetical protein
MTIPAAGADLSVLGPDLLVPFEVRHLSRPSLLWINERWFAEKGVDLANPEVDAEIRAWLLREFAMGVPAPGDPNGAFTSQTATLHADRYGRTGGAQHGGSGRCGIAGRFHAKGIGRTPLVADDGDAMHSSGMMLVWEAIMEAILSEIAQAELPYGAVPVIAIIDMGFASSEGPFAGRRGILVRPNFIRPAHFERSIFFGDGGTPDSQQYRDALRVRAAVTAAPSLPEAAGGTAGSLLRAMFLRFAHQIGAAQAHRFWLGTFTSSNRSIAGELADFGAFRAVPSWRSVTTLAPEQFGGELATLAPAINSIFFYFRKYLPAHDLGDPAALQREIAAETLRGFRTACATALGVDESASPALEALRAYYAGQQRERVKAGDRNAWRSPWLLDALAPGWRRDAACRPAEREIAAALLHGIAADGADAATRAVRLNALRRWLTPRHAIYQELMVRRIPAWVRTLTGDPSADAGRVGHFIAGQIARSRRVWHGAPPGLEVTAQAPGRDPILFGHDHRRREEGAWILRREGASWLPRRQWDDGEAKSVRDRYKVAYRYPFAPPE